ncbi:MAG: TonB-dependent receptor [Wenzhouxiangellaceae bacterium]
MIDSTTTIQKRTPLGRAIRMALVSGLCIGLGVVQAQEEESEAEQEITTSDLADIDTVRVTARRREENLQDVPMSISSFTGEFLQDQGALDITYLNQVVPNVTIERSRGTSTTLTAFIRGVGQQDPVAGFENGVGIYLDDVILNRPQGAVLDLYDVERVEVLRGPQGTLYGRNTIGGAVKYVTKRLGNEPSLSIEGSLGKFDQRDLIVKGELPITDTFAIGASFVTFNRDGFGRNLFLGEDNFDKDITAFRASMEWTPHDRVFIRLSGDYMDDSSNPVGGHRQIPGLFSGAPVLDNKFHTRSGLQGRNEAEAWGVTLLAEIELSERWGFKTITAFRDDEHWQLVDFEALPAADVDVPILYDNEQFTQELQLSYTSDRIAGVGGFYYLDAEAFNPFDVLLATTGDLIGLPGLNAFTLSDVETESWALFADVSFALDEFFDLGTGLELTLGGRYTEDKRTSRVLRQTMIGGHSEFFGGQGFPIETTSDFQGSKTFTDFSPKVSLAWQPVPEHNIYGSFSQGFKGGSFDPRGLTTAAPDLDGDGVVSEEEIFEFMQFDPEEVDTWEFGVKSSFARGRINTSFAFFYSDYTDIQIPGSIGVDTTGDGVFDSFSGVTTNAGEATVKGFEFEGSAILAENIFGGGDSLSTTFAVGYVDAEFDEFITAVANPATGETALQDVSDDRVFQNTPEWTSHLGLRYERGLNLFGQPGSLAVLGSWSYRDDTNQFEIPSPFLDQSSYSLFDAGIVWKHMDGRYEIAAHGRNLSDKRYITAGHQFVTNDGQTSTLGLEGVANAFFGEPRTWTLTARVRF